MRTQTQSRTQNPQSKLSDENTEKTQENVSNQIWKKKKRESELKKNKTNRQFFAGF